MEFLPKVLFDHTRSYLTFTELHRSRSTAKEWVDISSIPKSLEINDWISPPLTANYDQVFHLTLEDHVYAEIPPLPKLKSFYFTISSFYVLEDDESHFNDVLTNSPRLEHLILERVSLDVLDFTLLQNLKKLEIWDASIDAIRNPEKCKISSIIFDHSRNRNPLHGWDDCFLNELELVHFENDLIDYFEDHPFELPFSQWFDKQPKLALKIPMGVHGRGKVDTGFPLLKMSCLVTIESITLNPYEWKIYRTYDHLPFDFEADPDDLMVNYFKTSLLNLRRVRHAPFIIQSDLPPEQHEWFRKLVDLTELLTQNELEEMFQSS